MRCYRTLMAIVGQLFSPAELHRKIWRLYFSRPTRRLELLRRVSKLSIAIKADTRVSIRTFVASATIKTSWTNLDRRLFVKALAPT